MVGLGAGYGRWLVRAVAALRRLNPMPYKLAAVEPEPTHFEWLKKHMRDNGIDPAEHQLFKAAVNSTGERVRFYVGNPSGWYGQAIAPGLPIRAGVAGLQLFDQVTGDKILLCIVLRCPQK